MEKLVKFMMVSTLALGLTSSAFASGYEKGTAMDDGSVKGSMMEEMAHAPVYKIDAVHSTIGFAVKHLQISTTRGKFSDYTGTIHYDVDDLKAFHADVTIQVASIDTDNEGRDEHLVSGDFFDVENHPTITFKSDRLDKRGEGYVMVGDLTIRGITKELTFPVELAGPVQSPHGKTVMGLNGKIVINRQDFGVSFSKKMDNGGLMVGDNVTLIVELELHQEAEM